MVARALLDEGVPVASRQVVEEDEGVVGPALEAAPLTGPRGGPGAAGGSGGEVVRRVLSASPAPGWC